MDGPRTAADPSSSRYSSLTQINRSNVRHPRGRLDLRFRRSRRPADQPDRRRRRAVRDHAGAQGGRARRRDRDAPLAFDSEHRRPRAESRRHVLVERRRSAHLHRAGTSFMRSTRAPATPIADFGRDGRIDLREDLGRDPATQSVRLTTPGVVYKDLVIVGGRVSEGLPASPGRHSRLRRADRRAAMDVSHHSASGRIRLRDLAEGGVDLHRRRQQLGGHGGRREPRPRLRADRIGVGRFLRRQPARRQPVRQLADRARCRRPAAASGISRPSITISGIAIFRRRRAWSR